MYAITLRHLEYLVAVASAQSLSGAAEICHVSPVAVGQGLDELEKQIKAKLTIRLRSKGVALTPLGEVVTAHAQKILLDFAVFPSLVEHEQQRLRTKLTIGVFKTLGPWVIPPILRGFQEHSPATTVDIVEGSFSDIHNALIQGSIDFYITYQGHHPQGVGISTITDLQPVVLVSAEHPLATRPEAHITDFADDTFVVQDVQPASTIVHNALANYGMETNVKFTPANGDLMRGIVAENLGVSLLFSFKPFRESLQGKPLVSVPVTGTGLSNAVILCTHPGKDLSPSEQFALELLRAAAG